MKIIALEEHLLTPAVKAAWSRQGGEGDDLSKVFDMKAIEAKLEDLGEARLRAMDESGVDIQVLSLTTPAVQNLDAVEAIPLARDVNDLIAATVTARPDRYEGFATLSTPAPAEAARELQRAVSELGLKGAMLCGRTGERNLDHTDFWPIFEAASDLRVPLHLHPQMPRQAVREAYYGGFGAGTDAVLAGGAIGWHYETGIQLLRMILAGVFDRHPDLQVILGHWGEVILFYLERIEGALARVETGLKRPFMAYVRDHVHVTPSGILSQAYLRRSIEILGAERILFSADYPFVPVPEGGARAFLHQAPLSDANKAKIAHGNWERLVQRIDAKSGAHAS